jgi:hypothetical protein
MAAPLSPSAGVPEFLGTLPTYPQGSTDRFPSSPSGSQARVRTVYR